jgi:hypothetical protein
LLHLIASCHQLVFTHLIHHLGLGMRGVHHLRFIARIPKPISTSGILSPPVVTDHPLP